MKNKNDTQKIESAAEAAQLELEIFQLLTQLYRLCPELKKLKGSNGLRNVRESLNGLLEIL